LLFIFHTLSEESQASLGTFCQKNCLKKHFFSSFKKKKNAFKNNFLTKALALTQTERIRKQISDLLYKIFNEKILTKLAQ
jgi:hypothetical protein